MTCRVQPYREDTTGLWGWQCWDCNREEGGYGSRPEAVEAGEQHAAEQADREIGGVRAGGQGTDRLTRAMAAWRAESREAS